MLIVGLSLVPYAGAAIKGTIGAPFPVDPAFASDLGLTVAVPLALLCLPAVPRALASARRRFTSQSGTL